MDYESHPAWPQVRDSYKAAVAAWESDDRIQHAAAMLGMSQWEYCGRYILLNFGGYTWTSSSTDQPLTSGHQLHAFLLAGGNREI